MTIQSDINSIAEKHLTDKHDPPTFEITPEGTIVTVQFYGPLAIDQYCGFGIEVSEKYPTTKILGPNLFSDFKIRILIKNIDN